MIRKTLLIISILITLFPAITLAKDTLYWQKVNWPPYQILQGENAGKGRFDVYIKLFQEQLPQYEHQNIEMNWTRFWEDVKVGKHVLNSMAIKTDERSHVAAFSQVISFALPHRIIMRRSTFEELGSPESVALADFIKDERFHCVLEQNRSYSKQLDDILHKREMDASIDRKAIAVEHILKMILAGRADYTIEYPVVVEYLRDKLHMENNSSLCSVRIVELPRYIPAHIAGPNNAWGLAVMRDIDKMIDELKTTNRYLEIQKMYHSDPKELAEIQAIHEELIVEKRPSVLISGIISTDTHTMAKSVLKEAYKRIGYDVQFKLFPAKRSLDLANQGETDGDIARIEGTEKVFQNLIPISTPIMKFQGFAYTKSITRDINNWSDLKGLRIGIVRGIRYATIGTKGLNPFFAENIPHLFRLLADDRIDIAIAGEKSGQIEIQKNIKNSGIHTVGKPLYTKPIFHFIHKKNKDLVEPLNHVLADMAAQGQIDSIINQTFQRRMTDEQGD